MRCPARLSTVFIFTILVACSEPGKPILFEPLAMPVPAAVPAKGPRISGDESSGLALTWMEPGDGHTTLRYSTYLDGKWSASTRVADVEDMFVNWADTPSVLPLGGGRLAAHWLQKSAARTYAYDVMVAHSRDDGATWSEPTRPHSDGTPTEHGFVSMFRSGDYTGLIWLDGRKTIDQTTDDSVANGMTLRGAFVDVAQNLQGMQLIDELTCDCCQTDVAIAATGPVAVYRDRTVDEIRDIYVTRLINRQWSVGQRIAADNWEISGCPVNGPSIAAEGDTIAVAWFTAADDRPAVKLAWSNDSGQHFSSPIEIAAGNVRGRVGLALLDDRTAAVSWLASDNTDANQVVVRSVDQKGELGSVITVSNAAAALAVPQLARFGNDLLFVWTSEVESQTVIASARLPIAAL
jgi:hypothetical protein